MAGLGAFPWVLKLNGGKLYLFERANLTESLVFLAIAASAMAAFLVARRSNT